MQTYSASLGAENGFSGHEKEYSAKNLTKQQAGKI
jgi:hypothetical protein